MSKTLYQVLDIIVNSGNSKIMGKPIDKISEKMPELSRNEISNLVDYLVELNLLSPGGGDELSRVFIKPAATAYLIELKDRAKTEKRKLWEDRSWNIIQSLISFVLGMFANMLFNKYF